MMLERGSVAICCPELFIDEPGRSAIRGVATTHQKERIQQYGAYIRMNSSFEDEKASDGIAMEPSNTMTTNLVFEPVRGMSEIPISDESIAALDGANGIWHFLLSNGLPKQELANLETASPLPKAALLERALRK